MNMNKKLLGCVLVGAAVVAPIGAAENKDDGATKAASAESATMTSTADYEISQLINGELSGVQKIKKDAMGHITSLVVIGRAPISAALSKARAKRQSFKKADAHARAEYSKWLTTGVRYWYGADSEVILAERNGESDGEALDMSEEQIEVVAAGLVKGLKQIGAGVNKDGDTAVVILAWSAVTAKQTDAVRNVNLPSAPKETKAKGCANGDDAANCTGESAKKSAPRPSISSDAGEYL